MSLQTLYCDTCQATTEFKAWETQPILVCMTCGNAYHLKEETMPEFERPRTWGDLLAFAVKNGLANEEYFTLCAHTKADDPIWGDSRWIAVYWVEGGSEGYYLHVDQLVWNEATQVNEARTFALGKYWMKASASIAVTLLTPWVHGLNPV
jgi:hypothetical protein